MQHEQRLANSFLTVEVNPVAPLNVFVVDYEPWSFLNVPDESLKLFLSFVTHILQLMKPFREQPLLVGMMLNITNLNVIVLVLALIIIINIMALCFQFLLFFLIIEICYMFINTQ